MVNAARQDKVGARGDDARMDAGTASDAGLAADQAHWPGTRRLTAVLLVAWCIVTFVLAYFARDLRFKVFGWPFSYWVGAQGGLIAYLAITCAYERGMARLDRNTAPPGRPEP